MGKFLAALYDGLSVHVRQIAWLNASPQRADEKVRVSRLEQMRKSRKDKDYYPPLPPTDAPHLLNYLFDVGPTLASGMGEGPLTHSEIEAWQGNTGVELEPWEATFLRRLSIDYLSESHKAEKVDAPAPWNPEDIKQFQSTQMRDHLRALSKL